MVQITNFLLPELIVKNKVIYLIITQRIRKRNRFAGNKLLSVRMQMTGMPDIGKFPEYSFPIFKM